MNIKHHLVLVPGKKKPVFEIPSLRCTGRLAQGAREPIKQDCNDPKTKLRASLGSERPAQLERACSPRCPGPGRSQTLSRSIPAPAAPSRDASLPKPVPIPASPSPPRSASSVQNERTLSKVYLLTLKHRYFLAGSQVMQSDKPDVSPDSGRTPHRAAQPPPAHRNPPHSASKSVSVFHIQRLFCLKNEAALHKGNREINSRYTKFPGANGDLIRRHPHPPDPPDGRSQVPSPCQRQERAAGTQRKLWL